MGEEILRCFQEYIPDLHSGSGEENAWEGTCPLCQSDGFIVGTVNISPGGSRGFFICQSCGRDGTFEDLKKTLGERQAEASLEGEQPPGHRGDIEVDSHQVMVKLDSNQATESGSVDGERPEKNFPEVRSEFERREPSKGNQGNKVFSLTRKQVRKLLDLAKEDYPSQVYRLVVWLTFLGGGLTANRLSLLTKIPLSSVYRTLQGNSIFCSVGKPAKFYVILDDSHG